MTTHKTAIATALTSAALAVTIPIANATTIETPLLPDSGQSVQYDTNGDILAASDSSFYTGQGASIQGNAPRYLDNGDGTVTDLNTGLMWQKAHDYTRRNMAETVEHVEEMTLAGNTDWRVPTIKELYSLANFDGELLKPEDGGESKPYINTDYFEHEYDKRLPFAGQI
ncbi:hypothetical protein ST37_06535 [Vibrio sp. qd031]|uniref:Lcl C-terminal domain-containing protein n=1 Tax=Vibrio sp. qd031 TaxID=1603038 RepID=UPI000A0FC563|nr:DUF1566 domain-containing protein [Vibrio sp. qd031]ORT51034.1 hypothetical protein ST37_06535 [Vibrio sp. qd031]